MEKVNFKRVLTASKSALKTHSPEVLTGIGIVGFITTIVMAVKVTPKAINNIENRKEVLGYSQNDRLPVKEIVLSCWKCYTPSVLLAVASTGCIIGGVSTSIRRTAAMATVAKVAETTLKEYSQKVVEEIGEEKEKKIREDSSKEAVKKIKVNDKVSNTQDGEQRLYCDSYTKRLFYATPVEVERAFGELNRTKDLYSEYTMNDWYSCFNLDETPAGYEIGWNADDGKVSYCITSALSYDDRAVLVVDFNIWPHIL